MRARGGRSCGCWCRSLVQWSQAELAQDSCMPQQIAGANPPGLREPLCVDAVKNLKGSRAEPCCVGMPTCLCTRQLPMGATRLASQVSG